MRRAVSTYLELEARYVSEELVDPDSVGPCLQVDLINIERVAGEIHAQAFGSDSFADEGQRRATVLLLDCDWG